MPTPDTAARRSRRRLWADAERPTAVKQPPVVHSNRGRANAARLKGVHDYLRSELAQVIDLITQVAEGSIAAGVARAEIAEMTVRQHSWATGAFCASFCLLVASHHGGEDEAIFPALRAHDPELGVVLDRLETEHRLIHDQLDEIDEVLVLLIEGRTRPADVMAAVDVLSDALLSHLAYEEAQLLDSLARLYG